MLDSAVKQGELEICHGGSQQNGPILGNGCASFLARFAVALAKRYQDLVANKEEQNDELDEIEFKTSLTDTLENMVSEDATQHGRLIDMKDQLIDLMPDKKLFAE